MLNWSEDPLEHNWNKYDQCQTHRQLKEELYEEIIDLFDKGNFFLKPLDNPNYLNHHWPKILANI